MRKFRVKADRDKYILVGLQTSCSTKGYSWKLCRLIAKTYCNQPNDLPSSALQRFEMLQHMYKGGKGIRLMRPISRIRLIRLGRLIRLCLPPRSLRSCRAQTHRLSRCSVTCESCSRSSSGGPTNNGVPWPRCQRTG